MQNGTALNYIAWVFIALQIVLTLGGYDGDFFDSNRGGFAALFLSLIA